MIKCNLAVLLAERGLKMSDIINDTGLSKTAVRGLYYNTSKGIQFDTLETICDYLHVKPGDVIKQIDFRYEIVDKKIDSNMGVVDYAIQFTFDNRKHLETITMSLWGPDINFLMENEHGYIEVYLEVSYDNETKQNILSQITEAEFEKLQHHLADDFFYSFNLDPDSHNIKDIFLKEI